MSTPQLPDDEWATLATLTGFQAEPKVGSRSTTAVLDPPSAEIPPEQTVPSSEKLLEDEDIEQLEERSMTPRQLWTNPWAKGAFVAALTGFGFGMVGVFLWSAQNFKPVPQAKVTPTPTDSASDQPSVDPQQEEIGNLKTVNGLGSQARIIKQNQQSATGARALPPTKGKTPAAASQSPPQNRSPVAASTVVTAPERARPVLRSPTPISAPVASTPIVQPPTRIRESLPSSTRTTINPQTTWQEVRSLGSYGEIAAETADRTSAVAEQDTNELAVSPKEKENPTLNAKQPDAESDSTIATPTTQYEAEVNAVLTETQSRFQSVNPGTIAQATLITPIFWAQDLKPEQQPQRFVLSLSEPLPSSNNSVALPAGTRMVAQVSSISESGMVEISVVAVIVPTRNEMQVIQVPPGAIQIAGEQGTPLIAKRQNTGRGAMLGADLKTAAFAALGQVGTLMNRPSSESTTTSPYLSSTNVNNGNTNIVGGILQGAFGSLSQAQQQRTQQEIQEIQKRPSLWIVPTGQRLQIVVNQSFGVSI